MSNHSKQIFIKSKIFIYISAAVGAALIAVIVALLLVNRIKNPPTNSTVNINNQASSTSSMSSQSTPVDNIIVPNTEKPVIRGVENGKIYYTTQHINITDNNLKSVTVNGDDFNDAFFIEGNTENMYVIEAIDYDDNVTTYIVYTKPIKSLLDAINTLNEFRITADDLEKIESVKAAASSTGTRYSSPEETNELDNILLICENFLSKINNIQEKIDALTNDYTNPEYINSAKTNAQKLASIITNIDEMLATNNLTTAQRTQLTTMRAKYSTWLAEASAMEPLS